MASAATAASAAITKQASATLSALKASGSASKEELEAARAVLQKARASETATRAEVARVTALRAEANALAAVGSAATVAGTKVASAGTSIDAATGQLKFNTANIAAQFQDIGVTAAMGMNPLQIALQQGTQLSAVLNDSVSKGISPVKALGAAFVQIINPVSLTTIALIALGAAGLQALGQIVPKAETASEAIKRHREELERVVRGYGKAEEALDEYFDNVGRLPGFAVVEGLNTEFGKLGEMANSLGGRLQDTVDYIEALGGSATDTDREILRLVNSFNAGEITLEDLYRELGKTKEGMGGLEGAIGSLGLGATKTINDLRGLITTVIQLGNEYDRFIAQTFATAGTVGNADLQQALDLKVYIAEQERINGLTTEQLQLEREIARIKSQAGELGITDARAAELAEQTLAAEERRAEIAKQLRDADKAGTRTERERQAVLEFIEQLEHEYRLLGASNLEREVANGLRQAGAAATEEQRAQIEALITATYSEQEAIDKLNKSSQEWADTIQQATRGFIDDLIAGKDAAEAFSNVLSSIANKLIDVGLNSLFGTGGFNVAGLFGGGRAQGGPVSANTAYMVGENGPEMFVPYGAGKIVPNGQTQGGGGSVVFSPVIDARGADVAAVARLEQSLVRLSQEIVPTVRKELATAHKKGR
jgi:hypothetical protein